MLRKYLPCMLSELNVFMSKHDLQSGARWAIELARELDDSSFGLLCLDRTNLKSPWLIFEAGALTKHVEGRACGLLLGGLKPSDVGGPLSQFQHREFSSEEFLHLLHDLHKHLKNPIEHTQIELVHKKWWPDLKEEYDKLPKPKTKAGVKRSEPVRTERELLEELLDRTRAMERNVEVRRPLGVGRIIPHEGVFPVPNTESTPRPLKPVIVKLAKLMNHGELKHFEAAISGTPEDTLGQLMGLGWLHYDDTGTISMSPVARAFAVVEYE